MSLRSFFSNFGTKCKVAIAGVGAMIASTGQTTFGLQDFTRYLNFNNPVAQAVTWIGSITTLYVRIKTRFPALWKMFYPQKNIQPATPLTRKQKVLIGSIAVSGVLSGTSNAIQSYLGGGAVLELLTVNNDIADYVIGAYSAIASSVSYYAFFVQSALDNTRALTELKSVGSKRKLLWDIVKTALITCFGAAALGIFSFFTIEGFFDFFPQAVLAQIPQWVRLGLPIIGLVSTIVTTLLSRIAETFKYFSIEASLTHRGLDRCGILKLIPSAILGPLDTLAFAATLYIGCIRTAQKYNVYENNYVLMQILSTLASLSGGFIHYVFSVRKFIKKDIEIYRQEAIERGQRLMISLNNSDRPSDQKIEESTCLSRLCLRFGKVFKQEEIPNERMPLVVAAQPSGNAASLTFD